MRRLLFSAMTAAACIASSAGLPAQIYDRGPGDTCPGESGRTLPTRYPGPGDILPAAPAPSGAPWAADPGLPNRPAGRAPAPPWAYAPPTLTGWSMPWDDPSAWRHWWTLNRDPYLGLKALASQADVLTGSDDFFLGHGHGRGGEGREIELVDDATYFGQVVPVLARVLDEERDSNLRALALIALAEGGAGRTGAERLVERIVAQLDAGNQELAEAATAALGILGEPAAEPVLTKLLLCHARELNADHGLAFGAHVPSRQRAFAAYALGLLGQRAGGYWGARIVNTLARAVMDAGHGASELQAAGIAALGLVPLPVLGEHPGATGRTLLLSRQEQVRWLLGALDEGAFDARVRSQAPLSIARLLADAPADFALRELAVKRIATLMEERAGEQIPVRRGCAQALGWLVDCDQGQLDTALRQVLIEAGRGASDEGVRRFAWIALAQAAGRPGSEGEPLAGLAAARAALARELAEGGTPMRSWAALAVGVLERSLLDAGHPGSGDMRRALRAALADARSLEQVGACAIGIGLARDREAGALLMAEFATTRDPETRGDLALALGMIEERAALDVLRATCADSLHQPELLLHLAMGLALLGDKEIGGQLEALLDGAGSSSPRNLLAALGRVGAAHTVERLVTAARNGRTTSAERAAAVGALGRVVERDLLPWSSRLSVGAVYRSGVATLTTMPRGNGLLDLRAAY